MQETGPESGLSSEQRMPGEERQTLPLPHPYPDYVPCPHCGAPEVEIWCYQAAVQCYNCGAWIENKTQADCGNEANCPPRPAGDGSACWG